MLKRFIPKPLKQKIKDVIQRKALDDVLSTIAQLPEGTVPSEQVLEQLQRAWDNEGMAAQTAYLRAVAMHASQTEGPILECGSGLTTFLLGLIAGRRGVETWTLEHFPDWHGKVSRTLSSHGISAVHNCLASLRDYGDFEWYDAPVRQLPSSFALIICDGPPGSTKGGRYGLVPVLKDRFAPDAVILLDDADRPAEADAVNRWSRELDLQVELHAESRGQFAVIVCQPS